MKLSPGLAIGLWCRQEGLPEPVAEHPFALAETGRKFRFDFCWVAEKVALELEGVTREGGRHQRLAGYERDVEKYNLAIELGWRVVRATPRQFHRGDVFDLLGKLLRGTP